ncbi:MAG: tyrosine-type recombinase/integrase [Candidatus Woesearchaeota archaeon]
MGLEKIREEKLKETIQRVLKDDIKPAYKNKFYMNKKLSENNKKILVDFYRDLVLSKVPSKHRRALSLQTHLSYMKTIRLLGLFTNKDYKEIGMEDVDKYVMYYIDRGSTHGTLNTLRKCVKVFFRWLGKPEIDDGLKIEPMLIKRNRTSDLLTSEDIKTLVGACKNLRDKVIIQLLYDSGMRVGELLNLRIKDINFDDYGAEIELKGKTGERKIRVVDSVSILLQFINQHPFKNDREHCLFYCFGSKKFGSPLERPSIHSLLREVKDRTGIEKPTNPHNFRHSHLDYLGKCGFNERDIMMRAGWKTPDMAKVYLHYGEDHTNNKYAELKGKTIIKQELKTNELQAVICKRCQQTNNFDNLYCSKCGFALGKSLKDIKEKQDNFLLNLQDEIRKLKGAINNIGESHLLNPPIKMINELEVN